jgi:Fic family protein
MAGATDIVSRSLGERVIYSKIDSLRERHNRILGGADEEVRVEFQDKFDMSWIYHDCALEGQVLTPQEIWTALHTQIRSDSAFQPSLNDVRSHKQAIDFIRSLVTKKKVTIGPELVRRIYNLLADESEQCSGSLVYRKDIPIHRTYFHEIVAPSRLPYQMKKFFEWARDPSNRKLHPINYASSIHYRLMRIFPFTRHTGKLSRLVMNLVLIRAGYPPAIIHSTERQNYYEAIRDGFDELLELVKHALGDTMLSNISMLGR